MEPHGSPSERPAAPARAAFRRFVPITTRWADNDVYGHLNNVVYYSLFDTAVNRVLIDAGVLDPARGAVVGFVVETRCSFFSPLAYPGDVEAGLSVARIGTSSVAYALGVFGAGRPVASAAGRFVHVYVDRATRRPVPLPGALRALAEELV